MNKDKKTKTDKKEFMRYERWVKYLTNGVLTPEQVHERATQLTKAGREPR